MKENMRDAVRITKTSGLPESTMRSTRWSSEATCGKTLTEYPRPQLVRRHWCCLNGLWNYAITSSPQRPSEWDGRIRVPFSPESPLSGVSRQLQPGEFLWYQKLLTIPERNGRTLLHFGAVDQCCAIFLDEREIASHVGGYLPFTVDITEYLSENQESYTLMVRVADVSDTSYFSRGKQKLDRGGMYYTAQSGIWQTVWMEQVPECYISAVKIIPDYDSSTVRICVKTVGIPSMVTVSVCADDERLITWRDHPETALRPEENTIVSGTGPDIIFGLPEFNAWSPENPYLYRVVVTADDDRVESYFGMRCVTREKAADGFQRFFLNHREYTGIGLLDQGYWPDGLYTAPSDEALIFDIETAKKLGFNTLRKHCKLEPQRWYYHCDRLGLLVWQDMVPGGSPWKDWLVTYLATGLNAFQITLPDGKGMRRLLSRGDQDGRKLYLKEMDETVHQLNGHPSIAVWVPFNEGWGQFDANAVAERIRIMDPSRLVDHASGWFDRGGGDIISRHHYFFRLRFHTETQRLLALTEFGGYTWRVPGHVFLEGHYGYGGYESRETLSDAMSEKWKECLKLKKDGFSAFIWTQLSDIEDETNGMLTYDREILKPDVEILNRQLKELAET